MRLANNTKVAVLYGGCSAERAVSLNSGQAVHRALLSQGYQASLIDAMPGYVTELMAAQPDVVFLALHGRGGEDGTVQGLLEQLGYPYTGSGVTASAVCMDKVLTKQILAAQGLPTAGFQKVRKGQPLDPEQLVASLGLPLFVKPVHEGSSIGMSRVDRVEQLLAAVGVAAEYDEFILLEQFLPGPEYTVALVADQALPVVGVRPASGFYDYQAKYIGNSTQYLLPSGLSPAQEQQAQQLAKAAAQALGVRGWCRVDMMLDRLHHLQILEVNTAPGMTDHSLVPMAAKAAGWSFEQLVAILVEQALDRPQP